MDTSDIDLKNPHIALAVSTVVVVIGAVLFHDDGEGAMQLVALVGLVVMFGTLFALDARDDRRQKRHERSQ